MSCSWLYRTALVAGLSGVLLAPALPVQAQTDEGVEVLAALLQQTDSLQATISQLVMDQDGRELQENTVTLLMRKPASFSWEITAPYAELMVTNGDTLWRYEPDLEQVTIQRFDDELDRTPVMLLNGNAETIGAAYAVDVTQMTSDIQRFILRPLRPGSLFESMSLTFEGLTLREMQFEDSLGQQTSLSFDTVTRNLTLPDSAFTFTPPAGVELIDNRAGAAP